MNERRWEIHRIEFAMKWPPNRVAAYLLAGPEPVLVDAGMRSGYEGAEGAAPDETFRAALADHGYGPADVAHVMVTHPHVDHIGQVGTVLEAGDPTVYAPAGVRERFGRDPDDLAAQVRANAHRAGMPVDERRRAVEVAVESLERDAELLPVDAVDVWVEPGGLAVGPLEFRAVHAPGHQADHVCYAGEIAGERALLSGDMAIELFRPVLIHDGLANGYREAIPAFRGALDRLAALDIDRVYPGHGPVHERFGAVIERDRESVDRRLDRVERLLEEYSTGFEVSEAMAGDHPTRHIVPETMSALAALEERGRVAVSGEDADGAVHYEPVR